MRKYIVIILVLLGAIWFFKFAKHYPTISEIRTDNQFWGVTFSTKLAGELGLDWQEVYTATIEDLQVKQIRLPIYWDEIEIREGEFDFSVYDTILNQGVEQDVEFLVGVGWRLPRWPECHTPIWLENLDISTKQARTIKMLQIVINRYKHRSEIIGWQLENEALVNWFGLCPPADEEFLQKEIALVKSLDSRPITLTVSGELSMWTREAELADNLGTSVYRVAWNPWFGYWRWFVPAKFYNWKANRVNKAGKVMISELQAEPWAPSGDLLGLSDKERRKSFDIEQFKANLQLAQDINFSPNYLWGVEWWYLQKAKGDNIYWDLAESLFK